MQDLKEEMGVFFFLIRSLRCLTFHITLVPCLGYTFLPELDAGPVLLGMVLTLR